VRQLILDIHVASNDPVRKTSKHISPRRGRSETIFKSSGISPGDSLTSEP
jgi:hypothetical protein